MQNSNFPQRLKDARVSAGISQTELAQKAAVAPGQINRYEAGKNMPRAHIIARLATALGVSIEWLMYGTKDPTTHHGDVLDVTVQKLPNGGAEVTIDMDEETRDLFQAAAHARNMSISDYLRESLIGEAKRRLKEENGSNLEPGDIDEIAQKVKKLLLEDGLTVKKK